MAPEPMLCIAAKVGAATPVDLLDETLAEDVVAAVAVAEALEDVDVTAAAV